MANAKKCDICGEYFDVPDVNPCRLDYEENFNLIRLHRARDPKDHTVSENWWLSFDACDTCYQRVLDYILAGAAKIHDGDAT